jgi:hypothetical protein|tara:strand:- start:6 stop:194 length:189 start_codon:yes stop_codon:yes gene_type:complete
MSKPKNHYEALVLALRLSVTAPTEELSAVGVIMAESFAAKLTDIEVARAKKEAAEAVAVIDD